ncbi:MAG: hypothetical protein FD167_5066 [bacterium]|jgi:hypothetical protein|nr:MAG: hypothetical protein FD167_5066 [bacterium]
MSQKQHSSISRKGLDSSFEAEETKKSKLLLQAQLLREQNQDEAASRFAQAAVIEENLSNICEKKGLIEKFVIHRFSAASCWAQAGNFYQAIMLCDPLLKRNDLSSRLRSRIENYIQTLRAKRMQWYEELVLETANREN